MGSSPAIISARLSAHDRREQLIRVAVDLFSQKGFKGTTTREIATAAGVTEAIIFRHFETKEHLYTAIIDQRLNSAVTAEWIAGFSAAMDRNDDEGVIRQLIGAIIGAHRTDPKFERLMLYAALEGNQIALLHLHQVSTLIVERFRSYFVRGQEKGRLRRGEPEAALTAVVGMAKFYALNKYVHGLKQQSLSDEQAVETFTRMAMDGLCNPKASRKR